MNKALVAFMLFLSPLAASAHDRLIGPLPKDILKHQNDLDYLAKSANFKSPEGSHGLHYFFAYNFTAQQLVKKLLDSARIDYELAALNVLNHCGAISDMGLDPQIKTRLSVLSSSKDKRVRRIAARTLRQITDIECRENRLYSALRLNYFRSEAQALALWNKVADHSRAALFDYVSMCKGSGIGGSWTRKAKLPPHKRLSKDGYIDWKLRLQKKIGVNEREYIEWYLHKVTNLEPEDGFKFQEHPNIGYDRSTP